MLLAARMVVLIIVLIVVLVFGISHTCGLQPPAQTSQWPVRQNNYPQFHPVQHQSSAGLAASATSAASAASASSEVPATDSTLAAATPTISADQNQVMSPQQLQHQPPPDQTTVLQQQMMQPQHYSHQLPFNSHTCWTSNSSKCIRLM
jgi:hypothetical protein